MVQTKPLPHDYLLAWGLPHGNSDVMPYSKQYFSGGPYSVWAFSIRSLGPGSYSPEIEGGVASFFDRTGNIRLEANIEYRFPIIAFLEGAVFADAGNVWNTKTIENLPGGKFESDFINELEIGTGVGLRVDIQNFIIRFDLAFPLHDPALLEGERWIYDFGSPIFNFAKVSFLRETYFSGKSHSVSIKILSLYFLAQFY